MSVAFRLPADEQSGAAKTDAFNANESVGTEFRATTKIGSDRGLPGKYCGTNEDDAMKETLRQQEVDAVTTPEKTSGNGIP